MLIKPELLIRKFGIELKRIGVEDLEKLRTWRNSEYVNNRMISNEYITKNMQENWFKGINNEINYYFIAKFNEEDVSVISIKNIENNSGEGAIYLVSEEFENTGILARIVLCFNDFVFDQINLDYIYSYVKRDNHKAITSTLAQGGLEDTERSTEEYIYFKVIKENYLKKTNKLRTILNKLQ